MNWYYRIRQAATVTLTWTTSTVAIFMCAVLVLWFFPVISHMTAFIASAVGGALVALFVFSLYIPLPLWGDEEE